MYKLGYNLNIQNCYGLKMFKRPPRSQLLRYDEINEYYMDPKKSKLIGIYSENFALLETQLWCTINMLACMHAIRIALDPKQYILKMAFEPALYRS